MKTTNLTGLMKTGENTLGFSNRDQHQIGFRPLTDDKILELDTKLRYLNVNSEFSSLIRKLANKMRFDAAMQIVEKE